MLKNLKLKKVNKSFVPEPRKSSSVLSVFGYPMSISHIRILVLSWSYFWTYIIQAGPVDYTECFSAEG